MTLFFATGMLPLQHPISYLLTALLALFVGIVIERWKSRLVQLEYSIYYHTIATSSQDKYWGTISVLYNGKETAHLNFVTIEIANTSKRDLELLDVDVWVANTSRILTHSANYQTEGNAIYLEEKFFQDYLEAVKLINEDDKRKTEDMKHLSSFDIETKKMWLQENRAFDCLF